MFWSCVSFISSKCFSWFENLLTNFKYVNSIYFRASESELPTYSELSRSPYYLIASLIVWMLLTGVSLGRYLRLFPQKNDKSALIGHNESRHWSQGLKQKAPNKKRLVSVLQYLHAWHFYVIRHYQLLSLAVICHPSVKRYSLSSVLNLVARYLH